MGAGSRSITWFPGHMRQALTALRRVIKGVDLVLEVRDARVPLSSRNPELDALFRQKRHILVLNKDDLVPSKLQQAAVARLQQDALVLSASCSSAAGVGQVMHTALEWLQRERAASELSVMLVVGLPNSGKSSLINAFKLAAKKRGILAGEQAYQKKAKVGPTPGLTRQVAGFQVSAEPCVYVLDSAGVMVPAVPSDEVGLRLALAGTIKDAVVGEEAIVRYMLQHLARNPQHNLRMLRASGPLGKSGRRTGAKADPEVVRMRTCLYNTMSGTQPALRGKGPVAGEWHPDLDDGLHGMGLGGGASQAQPLPWFGAGMLRDAADGTEGDRFDQLMQCLGVANERIDSKQTGALIRLLRAFREGHLGKFMLDAEELVDLGG